MVAVLAIGVRAEGITLIEPGHTLILIADSAAPLHPSQALLGLNNTSAVPPTGIESITVDEQTGKIYVQVMDAPFLCPSTTTAIYEIDPSLGGLTVVINGLTNFGICERGSDMDVTDDPASGARILVAQDEFANRIATVSIPGGAIGTWVTPSVFAGNTFGMQFAPGIGVVPAGEIVYVADVGGDINSAPFGGPSTPRAVPPGGGDDLYIQPDGDIVFVGDFNVGIHKYDPTTFLGTPAALPDVQTMFGNAGLVFKFGTRATVCPNSGEGLISFSGAPGGSGVFRLNEPLTVNNLVLTMAADEGIQDLTVGPASDGSGNTSFYMTVENWTTGAHQVWEVTNACPTQVPSKGPKWTQLPHPDGEGFDAPSNLWWNKNPGSGTHRVLADDFQSMADPLGFCQEVCQVTWNGSYVDPNFAVGGIDGFIISFFTDQPAVGSAPSQPLDLIVSYFVDQFEETVSATCPPGCDGHDVFSYNADLRNACVIADPMGIIVPNECLPMPAAGTIWWISIEPVLGFVYSKSFPTPCQQLKTGNTWPNDFWGWHTTYPTTNFNDDAFSGTLSIGPPPTKTLTYDWQRDLHWFDVANATCQPSFPPFSGATSVDLSFDLHDIQFNNCWDQPACDLNLLPADPAAAGVDVPAHYQWTGGDLPPVNVVVADDFISDGRPITGVRWWGSYFDLRFEPFLRDGGGLGTGRAAGSAPARPGPMTEPPYPGATVGARPAKRPDALGSEDGSLPSKLRGVGNPYQVEGWFISFHYADVNANPTCPPDLAAGDAPTVTGLYFAPAGAVQIIDTGMLDCFQERVFQYEVQLADCCLLCSLPDPRLPGVVPAQVDAFYEQADFRYWLDIQAVVGATFAPNAVGGCDKIVTGTLPSDQTATGDFWGWHTSPAVTQPQGPLDEACTGTIAVLPSVAPYCPDYANWVKQPWLCTFPPPPNRSDMAFELLTPICRCRGDINGDNVINGLDIPGFVRCLIGVPQAGDDCTCADMNGDGIQNMVDVQLFVTAILNKTPCP